MTGRRVAAEFRNEKIPQWKIRKESRKEGTKEGVDTTRCSSSDGGRECVSKV